MMQYRFIQQGEWNKQRRALLSIENKCFKKKDRTYVRIFKELINDILIVRDGRKAIGCFVCAALEESGDDLKRWDKNYGKNNTLYIFSIGVIPEYRNAGIGRSMMYKIIRNASRDYDRITLHTRDKGFYNMCIMLGFRNVRSGRLDNHKMYYMTKWLK